MEQDSLLTSPQLIMEEKKEKKSLAPRLLFDTYEEEFSEELPNDGFIVPQGGSLESPQVFSPKFSPIHTPKPQTSEVLEQEEESEYEDKLANISITKSF